MALLRATAWSQHRVCSQGCPFHGGPEDHLGTPEAADPWSSSKSCGRCGALGRWLGAGVGLGTMVAVCGLAWETFLTR